MATYKYDKTTGELTKIAGGTLYADTPVGTIQAFGGTAIPTGWLLCDGTELNRTDYPDLFAVIGTSFGTPSANTKFKLPDLRESTLKGTGLTSKSNNHYDSDGLALGEFIDDRVQVHRHYAFNGNYNGWNLFFSNISEGKVVRGDSTDYNNGKGTGEMATGRTGATTEVKAVGVNFIIKAKKIGAPTDIIEGVRDVLGSYSTTETVVGTWVDGKPIYRKVLVLNQTISSDTSIPSTIPSNADNYWIDFGTSYFVASTSSARLPLSYTHPSGLIYQVSAWLSDKNTIQVRIGSSQSVSKMVAVLEYTKTTD